MYNMQYSYSIVFLVTLTYRLTETKLLHACSHFGSGLLITFAGSGWYARSTLRTPIAAL